MSISFLSPKRTVLLMADEALYVYTTGPKGAQLEETIPWDAENFVYNVSDIIAKDCGRKPVLVLNDMVEQHYRKERILKSGVNMLDKASMLKRKLNVAFPNYPVRAAFPLKEKLVEAGGKKTSEIYIFAAVPESKQFSLAVSAVSMSLASIAGFCLLPVESSDMVKALSAKLTRKGQPKAKWSVLIGQHQNGGLRQIVIKNGELALTRMTPIIDSDRNPQVWAAEVHQEFKATMSYLARFGFQPEDGLQIILLANPAAGQEVENLIEEDCQFSALSVAQAANMLSLPVQVQEGTHYADVLHVVWAARKPKFILPMSAREIDKVSKPRQVAMIASLFFIAGAAFLGYQLVNESAALGEINRDYDDVQSRLAQLNVQYQKEVQKKEELGFDVRLVQSSIALHDKLEDLNVKPLPLFKGVGTALGKDMRLDRVIVKKAKQGAGASSAGFINAVLDKKPRKYEVTMQMTYPSTTDIDKGNQEVRDLSTRLQTILPDHTVKVTKFLKDYEYVEELVVETGDLEKQNLQQDFIAEIIIEGPEIGGEVTQ